MQLKRTLLEITGGLVLAAAAVTGWAVWKTGSNGTVDVEPDQVAVIVNYATGATEVRDQPGYAFHVPFLEEVFLLDRRPQLFQMEGEQQKHANHVRFLTVRARDGSNFWFESLEIQYRLLPAMAERALIDSGPGDAFREKWTRTYARAVLRDEFGRYDAQQVADLAESQTAKAESMRRLNELLAEHGVEIVQIITPKPKFDRIYEQTIDQRKIADQEVERLGTQLAQLQEHRGQKLAKLKKEKDLELEDVRGTLAKERIQAQQQAVSIRGKAEAYALRRLSEGQARRAELVALATSERQRLTAEAQGLAASVAALAASGDIAVRAALVERLHEIRFRVTPAQPDTILTGLAALPAAPAPTGM